MNYFKKIYPISVIIIFYCTRATSQRTAPAKSQGGEHARTLGLLGPLLNWGLTQPFLGDYYSAAILPSSSQSGVQNSLYNNGGYAAFRPYHSLVGSIFGFAPPYYANGNNYRPPVYPNYNNYAGSYGNPQTSPINRPTLTNSNFGSGTISSLSPNSPNYGNHNGGSLNNVQVLQLANLLGQALGQQLRPYINREAITGSPITYARRQ